MMKNIYLLAFLSMQCAISSADSLLSSLDPQTFQSVGNEVDETFAVYPDSQGKPYFPKGEESFYTIYLAAMKEPSLMAKDNEAKVFRLRFTWLRSFNDPIAIRIWNEGENRYIRAVRISTRPPDFRIGPMNKDVKRKLTNEEWSQVSAISELPGLWAPLNNEERVVVSPGMDGAQWIFELHDSTKYQMLDLWCPKDYSPQKFKKLGVDVSKLRDFSNFVRLGILLLKITGLKPGEDEEIY